MTYFPELLQATLLQVKPGSKSKLLEIVEAELILPAGCPSCRPTNSIKALNDE